MKKVQEKGILASKEVIKKDKALVDRSLRRYVEGLKGPLAIRKAMKYAVLSGGKRLRPILALECAKVLGGKIKDALPVACAVEMAHSFSLVHDDLPCMDDDDARRGKPTCHKKFTEGIAVLAGDGLLNLSFQIIASSRKNSKNSILLLANALGTANMIGGQALDLEYEKKRRKNKSLKSKIDTMKTAALMAASCSLGAITAGAKKKNIRIIHTFGENLGRAFQVADDIRDSSLRKKELKRMQEKTKLFISKAKTSIKVFKKKANTLNYIADIVSKRAGLN